MNKIIIIYDAFGSNATQDIGGIKVIHGINDIDITNDFQDSVNELLDDIIDSIDDDRFPSQVTQIDPRIGLAPFFVISRTYRMY